MYNRRDLPALDLLKAFAAAARHLSFTKAGAELFLSQSAVSHQIQMLETQLGTRLFERKVRSLLLTEAGQIYYREIVPILENLREVTARVARAQATGPVTVTCSISFASLWLVPRLSDFQRRHPDTVVHIAADNVIRDLGKERLDAAIRYSTRAQAGDGGVKLFGERVVPVCSPGLLARQPLSKPDELKQFVLLHYQDPQGMGAVVAMKVMYSAQRRWYHSPTASTPSSTA